MSMPTIYKEIEVEIELGDFEDKDLSDELISRGRKDLVILPISDAFDELFHNGVPLNIVLHQLFKDCPGYNHQLIEDICKIQN